MKSDEFTATKVRRCHIVATEPRERIAFDLERLGESESGLHIVLEWVARAPHLRVETTVSIEELRLIGELPSSEWADWEDLIAIHDEAVLRSLVEKRLLIVQGSSADEADQSSRDSHWHRTSAVAHYASRWQGIDIEQRDREFKEHAARKVLDYLGPPPVPVRERVEPAQRFRLPPAAPTPFDALLLKRVTCRNYDRSRELGLAEFSSVLFRTFGARAVVETAPGVRLLKKGVPSAGGLHPTEAYLLVQRVEGVAPGLYHYHPIDHALEPIRSLSAEEASELARRFVAAQAYFVDAHVMVIPTSRFRRNFWKYRNHAKAYRALTLDVGYLSHTIYLSATELGLAAFITAAINEVDIEQAFGLDPLEEGPLAVCGFGIRAAERKEVEFDPLHAVWLD
ncbi:putative peptide maturation dehydrogenase [Dokdonella ginsengisoli]|uniref:Peptide maturation dehydrogenase n=1 Tax=Dokdonella ginsengisoli TaxID=363846 RepID=A0ABV9QTK4_9GAMM